ncbi:ATP synthase alpha/beta family, beta-barrel domain protein [Mycobacterium xenopi 3993]|nr:ATP synthase alpha/beta family, beta-barrel domain protein [Mycobacterium xenopi 3993]
MMTQELLEFPGGILGVALNLDEHSVGAVILGEFEKIEEGQQVKRTGQVLSVPVGDGFLAGWSTRSASRSTPAATSPPKPAGRWKSRPVGGATSGCERAAADRHQGDRLDDPDRPRPAAADHRRPQDR